jgi:hypothetical protein
MWGWESHLVIVYAAAKSSGGGGLAALAFSGCSHLAAGFIRLCIPLGWWPRRVLRGRVEGPGRVLRARIEAPRLGGADAAGKGGEVFSLCAWLGGQLSWADLDGLPLGVFPLGCLGRRPKGRSGELVAQDGGRSSHKF